MLERFWIAPDKETKNQGEHQAKLQEINKSKGKPAASLNNKNDITNKIIIEKRQIFKNNPYIWTHKF